MIAARDSGWCSACLGRVRSSRTMIEHSSSFEHSSSSRSGAIQRPRVSAAAERARAEAMLARADAMDARAADAARRASDARSRALAAIQRHRTSR